MSDQNKWDEMFGDSEPAADDIEIEEEQESVIDRYAEEDDIDDPSPSEPAGDVEPDAPQEPADDADPVDPEGQAGSPADPDIPATDDSMEIDLGPEHGKATLADLKQSHLAAKQIQAAATRKFQEASELRKQSDEKLSDIEQRLDATVTDPQRLAEWLDKVVPPQVYADFLRLKAEAIQSKPDEFSEQAFTHRQQQWEIERQRQEVERQKQEFERQQQEAQQKLQQEAQHRIQALLDNTVPTAYKEVGIPEKASPAFLRPYLMNVLDYYHKQGHRIDDKLIRHAAKQLSNIDDVKNYLQSLGWQSQPQTPAEKYKNQPPAASAPVKKRKLTPVQRWQQMFGS